MTPVRRRRRKWLDRLGWYELLTGGSASTTRQVAGLFLGTSASPTSPAGVFVGKEQFTGWPFFHCVFQAYRDKIISSPNVLVVGDIGFGKSAFIKTWAVLRQLLLGRRVVVIDKKRQQVGTASDGAPIAAGEYTPLARALGARQVVEGWLDVYDRTALARGEQPGDDGIGTNEYMRSQGGYAVTIECGQHEDPQAISVAERAIHGALALLGLADVPAPPRFGGPAARLKDVVLRESPGDQLVRDWHSFDAVRAGDVIGVREDGTEVRAPYDGCVLFPHPEADVGQEWFYLAVFDAAA